MKITELIEKKPWTAWILFIGTIVIVFLVGWLGASIMERRNEAMMQYQIVKPIADWEPRNEVWGENYPREYETYKSTKDTTYLSKYGGNKKRDLLEEDPLNVVLWAGYAFSRDYNQARGHYYAINDIRNTLRTAVPQPATCWSCKSPDVPRLMNIMGPAKFYKGSWDSLGHEIVNNIGCQDCHDPKTMNLRITRPALAEAWQRQGKDINNATRQEMRSLVCAQCHVEYYFKGKVEKYLTFPWDKGFSADAMEAYYDSVGHVDFVHKLSKAPILKAQHPDYELYRTGIHAERGVACADCHMPYKNEGGVKFTNHKIASPLENISGSCQICHRESEQTLTKNVSDRQDKITELKQLAEKSIVAAHIEAAAAYKAGADSAELVPALKLIRHAQWRWDWVSAANAVGFHSPLEGARVLGTSIQKAEEARRFITQVLIKHNASPVVAFPDLSTKAKAQAYIGLDMKKLSDEKTEWRKKILPVWNAKAKERQGDVKY
ncbi:MAG: ammonia-forming cytochrome c nitrite reductase subunit c552 [Bacteroidota bacterium]|nr:ammonia-forming cytochrome c nitrite reductase subunit c552 [Bacteroidota bacterium]